MVTRISSGEYSVTVRPTKGKESIDGSGFVGLSGIHYSMASFEVVEGLTDPHVAREALKELAMYLVDGEHVDPKRPFTLEAKIKVED